MSEWQPIESAPKDGRTIQLRQGPFHPFHGRWSYGTWTPVEYFASYRPTHWRPVEAPSDGAS